MVNLPGYLRNIFCFAARPTMILCAALLLLSGQAGANGDVNSGGKTDLPELCGIIPQEGYCKGNFHVIFFDAASERCQEDWGCYDTVFKTSDECRRLCEKDAPAAVSPSEALLLYLNQGNGDPKLVKTFIEQGADVNYSDVEYRITPLHNAVHFGYGEVTKLLLEHGADVNAKNVEGNTPLFAAVHQQHAEITDILIRKGADVNAKNKYGYAPIRAASRTGNSKTLKMLIQGGADVNARDDQGSTPLHVAVAEGNADTVKILIDNGADIDAVGAFGDAPIHSAVAYRQIKIVEVLVSEGASLTIRDKRGNTPLDIAEQNDYAELIAIMKKHRGVEI
ncbi:MAG: ankyrin repeat domain-containing protein [Geobacteraceae bacterium]